MNHETEAWKELPATAASVDGEPIEGRIYMRPFPQPAESFQQAVTRRYNASLWGFLPNQEQILADKRRLYSFRLKAARKDLVFYSVMFALELFIAIFVTAHAKEPGSFGVWFCWALALGWGALWAWTYRTWRKAAAACADLR
jgi:hypothetical protein